MSKMQSLLGTFAVLADEFELTDLDGNPVDAIVAGKTVVHGQFKLVTKDQIALVIGVVTPGMCNASNKDGEPVYKFQGNGWEPEGSVGDILLQDAENPNDRWACKPDLFGGTGWNGTVQSDGSVAYAKPGKPVVALAIPEGTPVASLEGTRPAPAGCLLAFSKADNGDFYVWTKDVVDAYVNDYVE